jgi:cytochrome bd-type quinol oxidase subunit 2
MSDFIARNFKVSLVVLLIGCLVLLFNLSHSIESLHVLYGNYYYTALLPPILAILFTVPCWAVYYRYDEGNWYAFYAGFFMLVSALGLVASAAFADLSYSKLELAVVLYAGTSHVAYGLLDWRDVIKNLGNEP